MIFYHSASPRRLLGQPAPLSVHCLKKIAFMQKRLSFPAAIFSLLLALLSGCATPPPATDSAGETALPVRPCGAPFALTGRVSVQYTLALRDRDESLHGKFAWEQNGSQTHISLASPLGQTLAVMAVSPEQAVLATSGTPPVAAANADELFLRQMGWPLPISDLAYWLQGCAVQPDGTLLKAAPAHPEIATQTGWRIRYLDWMPLPENRLAPRRMDMAYDPPAEAPVSQLHIRLVIDEWHPLP